MGKQSRQQVDELRCCNISNEVSLLMGLNSDTGTVLLGVVVGKLDFFFSKHELISSVVLIFLFKKGHNSSHLAADRNSEAICRAGFVSVSTVADKMNSVFLFASIIKRKYCNAYISVLW